MRRDAWATWFVPRAKRYWPEALLAVLALAAFLGCLGSVELWGKREQRAAAEAIDTVDHNHWLVAEIQGRPRLEKPPLPRWSIAALMKITGCRAEWIVRLPSAISGVLTVALIYALGLRMGGREIALASSLVLCSLGFFVGEMRQASNDTLLALFTTLALYAAWRILDPAKDEAQGHSGIRRWGLVFYTALALGFLTKGPIVLLLVAVTIIPFLVFDRRLKGGLAALVSGPGLAVFVLIGSSWPIAVLIENPAAAQVWLLEMSEKTGLSQILEHRRHALLVADWPGMVLPWTLIALAAVILPFCHAKLIPARERSGDPGSQPRPWSFLWFAWWWGVGNLAVFCFWSVAKPNYYVPCLPGMALLIGSTWVRAGTSGPRPARAGCDDCSRDLANPVGLDVRGCGRGSDRRARAGARGSLAVVRRDRGGARDRDCLERARVAKRRDGSGPGAACDCLRDRLDRGLWPHCTGGKPGAQPPGAR